MRCAVVLLVLVVGLSHVFSEKAVICYYGTWATYRSGLGKFDVDNIDPFQCTHLMYAFAGINDAGTIIALDPYLDLPDNWGRDNFGKFNALKQKNPNLKTLLAVGGWNEGSAKYSVMAASPTLRKNFIDSALQLLSVHGFDGLDLDWEYPARRNTVHGAADVNNYSQLLKELKEEFVNHGYLLTAAVSSVRDTASISYDIPEISKYLDVINIMTYDMYGAWDTVTGHNSPLHKGEGDENAVTEDLYTVDQALAYWISQGAPLDKIAVGIPFYGRTFTLTNANVNGVRAPSSGAGIAGQFTATNGIIGYNEFCSLLLTQSWTQRYDNLAKVPYAFRNNDWVSFDNARSIIEKVNYYQSLGIDKIMMWSIETDDFHGTCGAGANPLLSTINFCLDNGIVASTTTTSSASTSTATSTSTTTSTATSTPTPTSTDSTISCTVTIPTDRPVVPGDSICKDEGFAANPENCSAFYMCIRNAAGDLVAKDFICPAELYWDETNSICNYQDQVECKV